MAGFEVFPEGKGKIRATCSSELFPLLPTLTVNGSNENATAFRSEIGQGNLLMLKNTLRASEARQLRGRSTTKR